MAEARAVTLAGDPHAPEVLTLRATALYGSGNVQMAQQLFTQALRCVRA